jgi:hypothetical protein
MELTEKIGTLEDELNLLKAEVKAVLVDLRDELLKRDGPFPMGSAAPAGDPPAARQDMPAAAETAPRKLKQTSAPGWDPGYDFAAPIDDVDSPEPIPFPSAPAPVSRQDRHVRLPEPTAAANAGAIPMPPLASPVPSLDGEGRHWGALDIASMGKFADMARRKIGRARLEEVLTVYELLTGQPTPQARQALLKMADLCSEAAEPEVVAMNDIVTVLTQLDALFRQNAMTEMTMLSLLSAAA